LNVTGGAAAAPDEVRTSSVEARSILAAGREISSLMAVSAILRFARYGRNPQSVFSV
jgi:hypothetical protein